MPMTYLGNELCIVEVLRLTVVASAAGSWKQLNWKLLNLTL
jgi:hypothetical protein